MIYIQAVVEEILQESLLQKLIQVYRRDIVIKGISGKKGNDYIRRSLKGFNEASKFIPHIIITDLDRVKCAPILISEWAGFPIKSTLLFRIAVKTSDAWILADRKSFSQFFGVPLNKIPLDTETITEPKRFIINLAKNSRKKFTKELIPVGNAIQGPGYNLHLQKFVFNHWNPEEAVRSNQSLRKAVERINAL